MQLDLAGRLARGERLGVGLGDLVGDAEVGGAPPLTRSTTSKRSPALAGAGKATLARLATSA